MQNISSRYTLHYNNSLNRKGHIFNGRYKSLNVDPEEYLIPLVQFIHNRPLEKNKEQKLNSYEWSSHQDYLGGKKHPWVISNEILEKIDLNSKLSKIKYIQLFSQKPNFKNDITFISGLKKSGVIGSKEFKDHILSLSDEDSDLQEGEGEKKTEIESSSAKEITLENIIEKSCELYDADQKDLDSKMRRKKLSDTRTSISYWVLQLETLSLSELAKKFNKDISTLSNGVRKLEKDAEKFEKVKALFSNP
jgi:hypothetical protein